MAEIPLVQSVREAADAGRPAVLQGSTPAAIAFLDFADKVVEEMNKRNQLEQPNVLKLQTLTVVQQIKMGI